MQEKNAWTWGWIFTSVWRCPWLSSFSTERLPFKFVVSFMRRGTLLNKTVLAGFSIVNSFCGQKQLYKDEGREEKVYLICGGYPGIFVDCSSHHIWLETFDEFYCYSYVEGGGARGSRTLMTLRSGDFKSPASTIPPSPQICSMQILPCFRLLVNHFEEDFSTSLF
jgi:hypothetical protein